MHSAPESDVPSLSPAATPPLAFRGRVFKALTLAPEGPVEAWIDGLDAALERSPTLFDGRAVVLDVTALRPDADALGHLIAALGERRIRIMGLEGPTDLEALRGEGLPPRFAAGRPAPLPDLPPAEPKPLTSVTVEGTLRSGQTVVNLTGDVTVTGSVSSGAEILAGGNIHIYGALRGRAIAGAARNPRARIYCRKFEPELLGIDRLVRTAEEVGEGLRGKPTQVWLDGDAMRIAILD